MDQRWSRCFRGSPGDLPPAPWDSLWECWDPSGLPGRTGLKSQDGCTGSEPMSIQAQTLAAQGEHRKVKGEHPVSSLP